MNLLIAFIHFNILFHFFFYHSQPVFIGMTDVKHFQYTSLDHCNRLISGTDHLDPVRFPEVPEISSGIPSPWSDTLHPQKKRGPPTYRLPADSLRIQRSPGGKRLRNPALTRPGCCSAPDRKSESPLFPEARHGPLFRPPGSEAETSSLPPGNHWHAKKDLPPGSRPVTFGKS